MPTDIQALRRECELHAPYRTMSIDPATVLALLDEIDLLEGHLANNEEKRDRLARRVEAGVQMAHELERIRDSARHFSQRQTERAGFTDACLRMNAIDGTATRALAAFDTARGEG